MTLADDIARYGGGTRVRFAVLASDEDVQAIAEGLEREKIIIDRAALPKVDLRSGYAQVGHLITAGDDYKLEVARRDMLAQVAWVEHLESAEAVRRDEEAELTKRRDELAAELGASPLIRGGYDDTFDSTQRAIDRIIELESGRA